MVITGAVRRAKLQSNHHHQQTNTRLVPRTRTCLGDRAFGVAGPRLWNALPISLRQPHLSLGQFRRALKTHLFDCLQGLVTFCFYGLTINNLTYLLTYPTFYKAGCPSASGRPSDSVKVAYWRKCLTIYGSAQRQAHMVF